MSPTQQNAPAANLAGGHSTSLPSATVAQNAVQNSNDVVLVAAVSPEQQNEFVGMTAEQLMQLDLYFVPGGETPATPQSGAPIEPESSGGETDCPQGVQDTSIFGALEPAAEEGAAIVAAADPNAPVDDIQQFQGQGQENPDSSDACVGDLTELSLLELMNVRVAAEPTPVLPQLQPVDLDTLFDRSDDAENNNRENLNEDTNEDTFFPPVPDPVQPLPPFNVSPIAGNDKYAVGEDGTLSVTGSGVLKNDSDGNGDLLSVSLFTGPTNGTLTLMSNGRFTYVPNANFNGKDTFTYQASDGNGGFDLATVMLTVAPVNDAPVLTTPAAIAVTEDTAATISGISVTDVDVGTGTITVTLMVSSGGLSATTGGGVTVTGPATNLTLSGTLADINAFLGGSNVTYTPELNDDGDVTLNVLVNDKGNTGGAAKTDSASIALDLQPVNDAPVAGDDKFTTKEDTVLSGTVAANDSDVDGGALVYSLVAGPIVGLTFNPDGTFSYTPPLNSNGPVTFDYQVDDGKGGTDTATVTINVTPVNDAPVAGDDTFTTDEDTPFADTVAANDSDVDGDTLTYSLVGGPVAGLTLNADGSFNYAPPLNSNGLVTFTYQVADGKGGTDTGTATINVTAVNDAPVATVPANIGVTEDVASDITGISFSDVDAGVGTVTVTLSASAGTLTAATAGGVTVAGSGTGTVLLTGTVAAINSFISGGNVDYTTAANDVNTQVLTATIDDGGNTGSGGAKSDSETVNLIVTPVNDAPVLTVPGTISIDEDVTTAVTGISVADVDAGTGSITVSLTVLSGTLAATSGSGITVGGTASALTLTGSLVDINAFIAAGNVSYTTALNNDSDVSLTVSVNDKGNTGTGGAQTDVEVVVLDIQPINDAPMAGDDSFTTKEDTTLNSKVSTNDSDVDGDTLTYSLVGPAIAGLTFNPDGTFSYAPPLNSNGPVTFDYQVDDGKGGTDTATVTINVTPVNDAPVAGDDTFTTDEDTPFADTVATNDGDVDGDTLTYSLVGGPVAGLTFNSDGTFSYAPPLNSNGPVNFTYQVADGKGGTDTATATINVTAVNDAPVAGDDSFTTKEDTTLNSKVSTNDSDVDGDTLTYSLVGPAIAGLTFNTDGTFSYVPPLNFNGPVTFDYLVDDGNSGTDTATVTINVTPVNDAPFDITLDTSTVDEETPGKLVIGNLTVSDPDALDTHSFTVDDARFEVVGGKLQLASGVSLDFETEPSVTIQVTAKDSGGLTHTESLVITVNDTAGDSKIGTDGPDSLAGADQDDTLSGGKDSDTLDGGAGSDSLDGGDDNDILDGGAGSDTLDGGNGSDGISGGDGNDLIIWDPADSGINGGTGTDTLAVLNGSDIDITLAPISSIEVINMVDGKANVLTVSAFDVFAISETGTMTIAGEAGDTLISGGGWSGPVSDGNGNNIYTHSVGPNTATLIVDQDITFV